MHGAWWGKEMCHGGLQQKFAVQYELLRATWRRKIVQDGWLHEGLDSSLPYALFCDACMHVCMVEYGSGCARSDRLLRGSRRRCPMPGRQM